jgi:hypothetical protein
MSDDYQSETVEEVQPTTGFDEETSNEEVSDANMESEEVQSDIPDAPNGKFVPLEVVESMREQARELKQHNEQLLQLMLSNQRQQQQPEQQQRQEELSFADDEFLTGGQLRAILAQQEQRSQQTFQQQQQTQRNAYIAEQKEVFISQYPDYNDVIGAVNAEAQKDPAIAEILMRGKNPVESAYRYGKLLRGESMGEVKSVQQKVSQEKKIQANLNQPRTLSNVKGNSISGNVELSAEEIYQSRFG